MKFFEAVANVFRVSGSAQAAAVCAGTPGGLSLRRSHSHAGHRRQPAVRIFPAQFRQRVRFIDLFSGGNAAQADHLRARHHAVYHGVDYSPVLTVVCRPSKKLQKEGELGRRQNYAVDPLPTVILALIQSFASPFALQQQAGMVLHPGIGFYL